METLETLGKYEIKRPLGRGAMGTVYEGWDPIIARRVAIKTVRLPDASDPDTEEALARFRREAQAAGRMSHPNIVGVFDYGETDDLAYIVMEFVDGPSLKSLLDKQERFALPDAMRIMEDLLVGLQFSHERGVVHRDIKPANVMLTSGGQAKIADFGIARIESSSMTQAGTVLGTPAYMSPEQFMGQVVDARTDIYSSGVLLYQLLTGERPFEGGMSAIMHKALNTEPPAPSQLSVTAPPSFDPVVRRAMAKRPEDRYPSASSFAESLRAAAANPSAIPEAEATMVAAPRPAVPSRPTPAATPIPTAIAPARARSPLPIVAAAVGVVLAGLGGGTWWVLRSPPDTPVQQAVVTPAPVIGSGAAQPAPVANTTTSPPAQVAIPAPTPPPAPVVTATAPAPAPVIGSPQPSPVVNANPTPPPVAIPAPTPSPPPAPVVTAAVPPQPATPRETPVQAPSPQQPATLPQVTTTPPATPPITVQPQPQPQPPAQAVAPPVAAPTPSPTPSPPVVIAQPQPVPQVQPPVPQAPQPAKEQLAFASGENLRRQLAQWATSRRCALLGGDVRDGGMIALAGLAGQSTLDELRQSLAGIAPPGQIDWRVNGVDPVFCRALEALSPIAAGFAATGPRLGLSMADGRTRLRDGEPIKIQLVMPDFASRLHVDYIAHDGSVQHLYPQQADPKIGIAADPPKTFAPGEQVNLGHPAWAVGEPYGTDLIMAVASADPLFDRHRPSNAERADTYLRDLQTALDNARRRGVRTAGSAVTLEALPK